MINEVKAQTKVGVAVDVLWKAMAKDLPMVVSRLMPHLVKDVQIIEGDGGIGTVYLINFCPAVGETCQKEKLVELNECLHRIALEIIEGGYLNVGFSYFKVTFQVTAAGEQETMFNATVAYESETEDTSRPLQTASFTCTFIKSLENYLLNNST